MLMQHIISITFDGNCREAMAHYAKVFKIEAGGILTYRDTPPDSNISFLESEADKVAISDIQIGGQTIHFGDRLSSATPFVAGNNITLQLFIEGLQEAARVFNELKEGGEVIQALHKPFYAELVGVTADKFGVIWCIIGQSPNE